MDVNLLCSIIPATPATFVCRHSSHNACLSPEGLSFERPLIKVSAKSSIHPALIMSFSKVISFDPANGAPSLSGEVILVTGGLDLPPDDLQ